jgi:hypothetical protein
MSGKLISVSKIYRRTEYSLGIGISADYARQHGWKEGDVVEGYAEADGSVRYVKQEETMQQMN